MTKQEAIVYALGMKEANTQEHFEMFIDIAIECIDKQILKKPVDVHHYGSGTSHMGGHCKCGFFVSKEMHNWCPKCGNKLDWSENE